MSNNKNLNKRKNESNDEHYTLYDDIQAELNHYEKHFRGKTVLCNCDDPFESNFTRYFLRNFEYLGLKRLICTSYKASVVIGSQFQPAEEIDHEHGFVLDVSSVPKAGRGVLDSDIRNLLSSGAVKRLEGDGDFRSPECVAYLDEADLVVTNPPFSLLNEYLQFLISRNKGFVIIGNENALHYKEIFSLFQANKIWTGYNHVKKFLRPDGSTATLGNVIWYTNLDIPKRHEKLIVYKHYSPEDYPKYLNFDAIEVNKIADIPCDYDGMMGVYETFMMAYNPDQFELIGLAEGELGKAIGFSANVSEEQRKEWLKENKSFRAGNPIYRDANGKLVKPFSRVIIRAKKEG